MAFIGRVQNALSGRVYKHNILIAETTGELYLKISKSKHNNYVIEWATQNVANVSGLLSHLMFPGLLQNEVAPKDNIFEDFCNHLNRTDKNKTYELFKLLTSCNLLLFLAHDCSHQLFATHDSNEDAFTQSIFRIFNYTLSDIEHFASTRNMIHSDGIKCFSILYEQMMLKGFGIEISSAEKLINKLALAEVLVQAFRQNA